MSKSKEHLPYALFMGGSRRMAKGLDDSRGRWAERKRSEQETRSHRRVKPDSTASATSTSSVIPENKTEYFTKPSSYEEAVSKHEEAKTRVQALMETIRAVRFSLQQEENQTYSKLEELRVLLDTYKRQLHLYLKLKYFYQSCQEYLYRDIRKKTEVFTSDEELNTEYERLCKERATHELQAQELQKLHEQKMHALHDRRVQQGRAQTIDELREEVALQAQIALQESRQKTAENSPKVIELLHELEDLRQQVRDSGSRMSEVTQSFLLPQTYEEIQGKSTACYYAISDREGQLASLKKDKKNRNLRAEYIIRQEIRFLALMKRVLNAYKNDFNSQRDSEIREKRHTQFTDEMQQVLVDCQMLTLQKKKLKREIKIIDKLLKED